ncbi:MAG TPA: GNAT family N-acetyltransferase [Syntrophobacteria bacterium]|nr:GNAT family N-acetyltransferase [Syntrophobacteria bacterium]
MSDIFFEKCSGDAVKAHLTELARLRLAIFREYPYLYDGELEHELKYLRIYAEAPGGCTILAVDGNAVVGAVTGAPLCHEIAEFTAPFAASTFPVAEIYYIGELLFSPAYRGQGLGSRLFDMLEEYALSLGTFRFLTCATVEREADHPLCPAGQVPIDRFCLKHGFIKHPELRASIPWREIDGVERAHEMVFWVKGLGGSA